MLGVLAGVDGRAETSVADVTTVMLVCAGLCGVSGMVFRRLAN